MELKYRDYSDDKLAVMAQQGDLSAEEVLMRKYKTVVKSKANMYYMAGADEDDIVQEGMIGLLKAIRKYSIEKEASFRTFASLCITRQIISAIRSADRDKHKALNTSISLSNPLKPEDEDIDVSLADTLMTDMGENPETMLVMKDVMYNISHNEDNIFSDMEMQVLSEALHGKSNEEIALGLGKNIKSVDNAMQRAKKKIMAYLWR